MFQNSASFSLEEYLSDLSHLINMDSGTEDVAGCWKNADFLASLLKDSGCEAEILPCGQEARPLLIARTASPVKDSAAPACSAPPRSKTYDFLLIGHLDTVFPAGTAAKRPFRIENGQAFGPGTVDMKAGALLMLYIARYMASICPQIRLCLAINSDEETSSASSAAHLLHLARKSRCAFVFEGGRKQGQFVSQRKGCMKYQIEISGIASHAGTAPAQGASAIVEGAHWILELDKQKRYERGTSVNVGFVEGGGALNVVADRCLLKAEIRYTSLSERRRLEKFIEKKIARPLVPGTSSQATILADTPPLTAARETQDLMAQMKIYGQRFGFPVEFVNAGGLSDANRIAAASIPIIDGCGPGGGFPHSEKEFLTISTVVQRFHFMSGLMQYLYSSYLQCTRV